MSKFEVLNEFDILLDFKLIGVSSSLQDNTEVMLMQFANDKNVEIDVVFVDCECHISEPFAIDNEMLPLDKERIMFKGVEYKKVGVSNVE